MDKNIVLETQLAKLRPMRSSDMEAFLLLVNESEMWKYFSVNLSDPAELGKWVDQAIEEHHHGKRIPFTIIDKLTGRIAGSMSIGNISEHDKRAEIGWSWLGKDFRGTDLNRHAKFSMIRWLIEDNHFERVEFKTDVLNERAKNGLRKIGGTEEGVLRSHMQMWNNRRRDSVYFSILKAEWEEIKQTIYKDIVG